MALTVWAAVLPGCREHRTWAAPTLVGALALDSTARLASAENRFFETDGVTVRYREMGIGPTVLLLHGYADRLEMWSDLADSLARTHRLIVPDLRGFGQSVLRAPSPSDVRAMISDVRRLCEALTTDPVHVVGYSIGGTLAVQLALDEPGRFASVTIVAGAFWEDSASAARALAPHVAAMRSDTGASSVLTAMLPGWTDAARRVRVAQLMADNDRQVLQQVLLGLPGVMPDWNRVRTTRVPATVIVGTADPLWTHNRRLASRWPDATFVAVPAGDHASVVHSPLMLAAVRHMAPSLRNRPQD